MAKELPADASWHVITPESNGTPDSPARTRALPSPTRVRLIEPRSVAPLKKSMVKPAASKSPPSTSTPNTSMGFEKARVRTLGFGFAKVLRTAGVGDSVSGGRPQVEKVAGAVAFLTAVGKNPITAPSVMLLTVVRSGNPLKLLIFAVPDW